MPIPRDFLDELDRELADACRALTNEAERLARLLELNRLACTASIRLGRPASVVELFDDAGPERAERLASLVRSLRGGLPDQLR